MAIKTSEIPQVERFFPGGYIHGINGYYILTPQKVGSPKTDYLKAGIRPPETVGGLFSQLANLHAQGATRVELQVLDKLGKKDYVEFHIDRIVPAEMLNPDPAKDFADLVELGTQMRTAQKEYFRSCGTGSAGKYYLNLAKQLEAAFDLKLSEIRNPEKPKATNQTELFTNL